MAHRARRRLPALALLVIALPALMLLLLSQPDLWRKKTWDMGGEAELSQLPEAQLISQIHALTPETVVPQPLIALLGDPRPAVADAARLAISDHFDHWRMLPAKDSARRVAEFARRLADMTPAMPENGRRQAAELAVQLVCWPLPEGTESSALLDHCERVLAAGGGAAHAAASEPPVDGGGAEAQPIAGDLPRRDMRPDPLQPIGDLPREVRRWPSLPFRPLSDDFERPRGRSGTTLPEVFLPASGWEEPRDNGVAEAGKFAGNAARDPESDVVEREAARDGENPSQAAAGAEEPRPRRTPMLDLRR